MEERQEEKMAKMHRAVFRTKEKQQNGRKTRGKERQDASRCIEQSLKQPSRWKKDKEKSCKMHRTVLRTMGKTS